MLVVVPHSAVSTLIVFLAKLEQFVRWQSSSLLHMSILLLLVQLCILQIDFEHVECLSRCCGFSFTLRLQGGCRPIQHKGEACRCRPGLFLLRQDADIDRDFIALLRDKV